MAFIEQSDAGGATIRLLKVKNFLYPPLSCLVIDGIPSLPIREDDIIVCAYPKAGTHWVWEIVRHLLAGTTTLPVETKDNSTIERKSAEVLNSLPSPRILNTHLLFDQLPAEAKQKRCKIICLNRNPKDVAVSCYHHHRQLINIYNYEGTWENFLPLFMDGQLDYGSWFDYVKDWERVVDTNPDFPIHVMSYEDLKENCVDEILNIAKFLGKDITKDFADAVSEKCSFHNMSTRNGNFETGSDREPILYRKDEVGDWMNWFTVVQSEAMDGYLRHYMSDSKLKFKYSLPHIPTRDYAIIDNNMNLM